MNISIDTSIRLRLIERRGQLRELADQSGVSYSWLSKFANGHIKNPGLRTLERIHDALARRLAIEALTGVSRYELR